MYKLHHTKKYYFEKMRHGLMTDVEVAHIFNVSVSSVRFGFIEYSKRKNPFLCPDTKIGSTLEFLLSLFAVMLTFLTLIEMRIERNNTYLPYISFQETTVGIAWHSNGSVNYGILDNEDFQSEAENFSANVDGIVLLEFSNIGVGSARDVRVQWNHKKNIKTLTGYLYSINDEADFSYKDTGFGAVVEAPGITFTVSYPSQLQIPHLDNDDTKQSLMLPIEYWEIIRQIIFNYTEHNSHIKPLRIPDLEIKLTFSDVQGKQYKVTKKIHFNMLELFSSATDDYGRAFYKLSEA